MAHDDEHDHAHGHGAPFTWDPEAERRRKGLRYILIGLVLIAAGALLWWLAYR